MTPPKISIEEVLVSNKLFTATAKVRSPEYAAQFKAVATLSADGNWWVMKRSDYVQLAAKWSPAGLGDRVAQVMQPIARALGLKPCAGCHGQPDGSSDGRQQTLNRVFPSTLVPPSAPAAPSIGAPSASIPPIASPPCSGQK